MVMQLSTTDSYAVEPSSVRRSDDVIATAYESYQAELYSFLRRSTRDAAAAEDLVQDAFLRLTREVRAGRAPDDARAWLYQVAGNLAISRARRAAVATRWLRRLATFERARAPFDSPEVNVLRRDRTAEMERVLDAESPELRTALLLAAQGFSGREVAAAIGRSEVATRSLLSRGRIRVRRALQATEVPL
jgi:RNA polymerase sigma factor (sigma-70 family)